MTTLLPPLLALTLWGSCDIRAWPATGGGLNFRQRLLWVESGRHLYGLEFFACFYSSAGPVWLLPRALISIFQPIVYRVQAEHGRIFKEIVAEISSLIVDAVFLN